MAIDYSNLAMVKPKMEYRRFGKTDKQISVITLGGMRYKHSWDQPKNEVPEDTLLQAKQTVEQAFAMGINHIETAYFYVKSEHIYGIVLNDMLKAKRDSYYLMTKGMPKTAEETRIMVEEQLKILKTDYIDFYGWHGINTQEQFETACKKNGPVEELHKLKEEGIINHVGFSTHGPLDIIIKTIETDLFEFVNLHYYYFFQRNRGAVDLAQVKDMGVFIISPNDKGGMLFQPPQKLKDITGSINPLQWNARFCLSNPAIHTLSMGLPKTASFEEVEDIFPVSVPLNEHDAKIKHKLDDQLLSDPYSGFDGYNMLGDPSGINIPLLLNFRRLLKCYDLKAYGQYRYNMMSEDSHWLPGAFPTEENLKKVDLSKCPEHIPLIDMLRETHQELYIEKK